MPQTDKQPIAWGMWIIVALVVVMGGVMALRPDKVISEPLPPGLMTPGQLVVAVYAEVDGVRREFRGPEVRLPVGTKFRMRIILSKQMKLSVGAKGPEGSFKSALLASSLPPGVHTFRKTLVVEPATDWTVMAGEPIAFADARMGMEVEGIERLRLRAVPPTPAAPATEPSAP